MAAMEVDENVPGGLSSQKTAFRRSSVGAKTVRRPTVLSDSTSQRNNGADSDGGDGDDDHALVAEGGDDCEARLEPGDEHETSLGRWGAFGTAIAAIDEDATAEAHWGAARARLREGAAIVDAAEAELAAGRDAVVLGLVDSIETKLPPPFDDPFAFANNYLPLCRPLRRFQVDAIAALAEGRDVFLAVRCGAGKSLPPAGRVPAARLLRPRRRRRRRRTGRRLRLRLRLRR